MTGGETSIHNDANGMEISITVSGFISKPRINRCRSGDILIGIRSSGLHSNGLTLTRHALRNRYRPEFTVPTKIYLDNILSLTSRLNIHGMMHITGGAFSKLKDILHACDAEIIHPKKLWPQNIFFDIYEAGVSNISMYRTFNCGIGFVVSVSKKDAPGALKHLHGSAIIGKVIKGDGKVKINSAFSKKKIIF